MMKRNQSYEFNFLRPIKEKQLAFKQLKLELMKLKQAKFTIISSVRESHEAYLNDGSDQSHGKNLKLLEQLQTIKKKESQLS